MQVLYQYLRLIICLIVCIVATLPLAFVFMLPSLIGNMFDSKTIEIFFSFFIFAAVICYVGLSLNWIFNSEVKSRLLAQTSVPLFAFILIIGTIITAFLGVIFTLPTLILIGYLLYWHQKKFQEYEVKVKKQQEDAEKIKKYDEYQKQIEEFENYQARLKHMQEVHKD